MKGFIKNDRLDIENAKYFLGIPQHMKYEILKKNKKDGDFKWV